MSIDENETPLSTDKSHRKLADLSPAERLALDEKIRQAIANGLMPTVAPNTFQIFMEKEVIENITPMEIAERKLSQSRLQGNTEENLWRPNADKHHRRVADLSPAERLALDEKIRLAIENGLMPREAPNTFRIFMENEVLENITAMERAEQRKK